MWLGSCVDGHICGCVRWLAHKGMHGSVVGDVCMCMSVQVSVYASVHAHGKNETAVFGMYLSAEMSHKP